MGSGEGGRGEEGRKQSKRGGGFTEDRESERVCGKVRESCHTASVISRSCTQCHNCQQSDNNANTVIASVESTDLLFLNHVCYATTVLTLMNLFSLLRRDKLRETKVETDRQRQRGRKRIHSKKENGEGRKGRSSRNGYCKCKMADQQSSVRSFTAKNDVFAVCV